MTLRSGSLARQAMPEASVTSAAWQPVRIDAVVRAADVPAARDPDAAPVRQRPELLPPARPPLDRLEALEEPVGRHAQPVHRLGVVADEVPAAELDGIDADGLRQL